ncbi:MAG: bifunctional rhamnulose-1-phosphate aldolase/short-chain dehydrogenase, partial [Saprospiraceae bacterium]|nr:bifunctional rhamnulose-1-phosphate aldolase/short-chain dehydrogenase [Saprospiraceae bacterium]
MQGQLYKHVDYLWDDTIAEGFSGDEVQLFLYRSNILGADLRVTNYGGGNTSCKTMENDPLTGDEREVMWIKGSGGDLGTLNHQGIASLYVDRLHALKNVYRGIEFEDEIVPLYYHCLFDPDGRSPSIDTALHGLLPFNHIDHLHPDAVIAIAAAKDSEEITRSIWGESMGWLPWQRPGFDLGLQLEACVNKSPGIRGIVLGGHGLFTWGKTSRDCYHNSLEVIEMASVYIDEAVQSNKSTLGGLRVKSLSKTDRHKRAAQIAPLLRGLCSNRDRMIGHFSDDNRVMEFINSNDLDRLAPLGTSCPDHFLRTKIKPLVLQLASDKDLDAQTTRAILEPQFQKYRDEYSAYYQACHDDDSPAMRDPNPVVILYPGVGMFTFARNKQTARVASEFYANAINVIRGAEAISEYVALPRQEAFNIEYWALEEAKLQRQPPEKLLARRVALVTGAGGGIGKAITEKLVAKGANVLLTDLDVDQLKEAGNGFTPDQAYVACCDVTNEASVEAAFV